MTTDLKPVPTVAPSRTSLPVICPEYDEDCTDMTHEEARECYLGFPNNSHLMAHGGFGPEGMGKAEGVCPILARFN